MKAADKESGPPLRSAASRLAEVVLGILILHVLSFGPIIFGVTHGYLSWEDNSASRIVITGFYFPELLLIGPGSDYPGGRLVVSYANWWRELGTR